MKRFWRSSRPFIAFQWPISYYSVHSPRRVDFPIAQASQLRAQIPDDCWWVVIFATRTNGLGEGIVSLLPLLDSIGISPQARGYAYWSLTLISEGLGLA
jgi:hypothetical protein